METEGRLIEKRGLENGLTIYFYDQSRPIAGNRYQVQLLISIPMEVKDHHFQGKSDPRQAYELFTAAFGKTIRFTLAKVRNFIDDTKVAATLDQMKEEFVRSSMAYVSKSNFTQKYILKKYEEWEKEETQRTAYLEALGGTKNKT